MSALLEDDATGDHRPPPPLWAPLFAAIERRESLAVLRTIVQDAPDSVRTRCDDDNGSNNPGGGFAIHKAVRELSTPEIVRFLASEHPPALQECDGDGYTPLHWAVRQQASLEIFRCLVELCPEALYRKTSTESGFLPLHLALDSEHEEGNNDDDEAAASADAAGEWGAMSLFRVVRYLIEQCPASVRVRSGRGWLPIHHAVRGSTVPSRERVGHEASDALQVIRLLVGEWPGSLMKETTLTEGMTALHVAINEFAPP
jgi:ankyrin repeat protein